MFKFRTTRVKDPEVQLNFEQLARMLPDHQYAVAFNLAAGAGAVTTVPLLNPLPAQWIPVGYMNYAGVVAFQDTVTFAARQLTAQSVEIALHNNGAGLATGTFYFCILSPPT